MTRDWLRLRTGRARSALDVWRETFSDLGPLTQSELLEQAYRQALAEAVALVDDAPAAAVEVEPLPLPWRCRVFGHAWRQGSGPVALSCERCLRVKFWPALPRAPEVEMGGRAVVLGTARESVKAGEQVEIDVDLKGDGFVRPIRYATPLTVADAQRAGLSPLDFEDPPPESGET